MYVFSVLLIEQTFVSIFFFAGCFHVMNLPAMIRQSTTLAQLLDLEKKYSLSKHEKDIMFGKTIGTI